MPIVIGDPHYRGKGIGRKVLSALVRRGRAEPLQPGAKAGNENNAKENVFMDEAITQKLFPLQDETYQAFQSKLMPTVSPETIIGVRTPLLRKLAKELSGTALAEAFLNTRILRGEQPPCISRGKHPALRQGTGRNREIPALH